MKILLSKESKRNLLTSLKNEHSCSSLKELSESLNVPLKTIEGWFYFETRYIPKEIIDGSPQNQSLRILDEQNDNWGQIKGGKKSYDLAVKKFGIQGVKNRMSLGGINAAKTKEKSERKSFNINIEDPKFLEFYGALIGDGWINHPGSKNKWLIGICGNLLLDKEFISYMSQNINDLFRRRGYLVEKLDGNVIYFLFKHKLLVEFMRDELNFPLGKKINLKVSENVYDLGFDKMRHVIRGIFDTDGSFYLDKGRSGGNRPCISIHMNAPALIKQIGNVLLEQGFKLSYSDNGKQIKLRGKIQLSKWMREIGSSNPKHLNKIKQILPG